MAIKEDKWIADGGSLYFNDEIFPVLKDPYAANMVKTIAHMCNHYGRLVGVAEIALRHIDRSKVNEKQFILLQTELNKARLEG